MNVYVLSVAHSDQPVIGVYESKALAMMATPGRPRWIEGDRLTVGTSNDGLKVYRIERMEVR